MRVAWAFVLFTSAVANGGCRDGHSVAVAVPMPHATDASAGAPARETEAPALRVVALTGERAQLLAWGRSRVLLDAGVFVYGATARSLELLGQPSDYARDAGGDDLVGHASRSPLLLGPSRLTPEDDRVFLAARSGARVWNGKQWSASELDSDEVRRRGSAQRHSAMNLNVGRDERELSNCALVLSADAETYGTCTNAPLLRFGAAGFVADPRSRIDGVASGPMAVARDGALWFGRGDRLVRVTAEGASSELALPAPESALSLPRFSGSYEEMMSAVYVRSPSGARYWQSTFLEARAESAKPLGVSTIIPLPDGSIWALAYTDRTPRPPSAIVYRYGAGDARPIATGSPFDQQVEIRNTAGLRPWSRACPQAFVVAPGTDLKAPGALAIAAGARKNKVSVHLVEGVFPGRRVRGALLYLSAPVDATALAAPTTKLRELFADEHGTAAEAFCSVPLVTQILDDAGR